MNSQSESPFDELPEALVEEMLGQCDDLGNDLLNSFEKLYGYKSELREKLMEQKKLMRDTELSFTSAHPTTCGVDGAYTIDRLLSTDVVAIAGVAVEGLTPPTEKRHWPKPRHYSKVLAASHSDSTGVVARAVMMCMELELGAKAPHDVIFLDGSLTTPFIYFNQALNKREEVSENLSSLLSEWLRGALESYKEILTSNRSDKIFVGVPKYTTKKEITEGILGIDGYEDRGLLSFILEPGEFVGPVEIKPPRSEWHIDRAPKDARKIINEIKDALENLHIIYYRPYTHFPALRLEISQSIASNIQRIAVLFEALRLQCSVPSIMEPYPLYMADRMVKHLGTALPAIRKTTTQEMVLRGKESSGDIYLAMHGYRTEWGK